MRVLVACEFSGRVRDAFRKLGHDAWSCDLLPTEAALPGEKLADAPHFQADIFEVLSNSGPWDLMIAHPTCTYLTVSGVLWCTHIPKKPKPGVLYGEDRIRAIGEAVRFARRLGEYGSAKRIALENPIGLLSSRWRKPDQVIQPWQFGHPEFKATCIWRKNLPPLKSTNVLAPPKKGTPEFKAWSKVHYASPGPDRWLIRSRTYQGIADAMASQWGIFEN